ncbi:MAG: M48 family metallopeptidase [Myxococcales bacterium]|nr:M48 family metallopeptidase [Myxococcales bacterium]
MLIEDDLRKALRRINLDPNGELRLAHLVDPNHTPEFLQRVTRAMPDYEQRKLWLAEHGGRLVVL